MTSGRTVRKLSPNSCMHGLACGSMSNTEDAWGSASAPGRDDMHGLHGSSSCTPRRPLNSAVETRISMHPHKPHATSQPSRFSHTPRLSTDADAGFPSQCSLRHSTDPDSGVQDTSKLSEWIQCATGYSTGSRHTATADLRRRCAPAPSRGTTALCLS